MAPNSRRRRLLLLSTCSSIGGVERMVLGLTRQFTQRDWDVATYFPADADSGVLLEWAVAQGVPVRVSDRLLELSAPHTLRGVAALRSLVREHDPDVVNIHVGESFWSIKDAVAVRLARPPRIVVSAHLPRPWDEAGARKRRLTRLAATMANEVIAVSNPVREVLLEAGVPDRKIHVIHGGVPVPEQVGQAAARTALGLPADAFVVSTAGRMVPAKATDDVIEAIAALPPDIENVVLAVAGDGPLRETLEVLARDRLGERCRFLGSLPTLDALYAASDVFVLPSHIEGWPLVFMEAALHGLPCVGSHVGGVADQIAHGETGYVVEPGDRAAVTEAVARLHSDPGLRATLGAAARSHALDQFTEERMADRYERVYLSGPGQPPSTDRRLAPPRDTNTTVGGRA